VGCSFRTNRVNGEDGWTELEDRVAFAKASCATQAKNKLEGGDRSVLVAADLDSLTSCCVVSFKCREESKRNAPSRKLLVTGGSPDSDELKVKSSQQAAAQQEARDKAQTEYDNFMADEKIKKNERGQKLAEMKAGLEAKRLQVDTLVKDVSNAKLAADISAKELGLANERREKMPKTVMIEVDADAEMEARTSQCIAWEAPECDLNERWL